MTAQELAAKLIDKFGGQAQAAKKAGVCQATLSKIARGVTVDVKISTVDKLKNGLKQKAGV